jgi:hypothetical protein
MKLPIVITIAVASGFIVAAIVRYVLSERSFKRYQRLFVLEPLEPEKARETAIGMKHIPFMPGIDWSRATRQASLIGICVAALLFLILK